MSNSSRWRSVFTGASSILTRLKTGKAASYVGAFIGRLKVKPSAGGIVLLAMIGIVVVSGSLYGRIQRLSNLGRELAKVEQDLARAKEQTVDYLPPSEAERRAWSAAEARFRERFPPDRNVPQFASDLANVASSFSVQFDLSPAPHEQTQPPFVMPEIKVKLTPYRVKLTFADSYRDLAGFLDALYNIPRVWGVESLEVRRGYPFLSGDVTLLLYYSEAQGDG